VEWGLFLTVAVVVVGRARVEGDDFVVPDIDIQNGGGMVDEAADGVLVGVECDDAIADLDDRGVVGAGDAGRRDARVGPLVGVVPSPTAEL
jgi:hypothetical protein